MLESKKLFWTPSGGYLTNWMAEAERKLVEAWLFLAGLGVGAVVVVVEVTILVKVVVVVAV